MFTGIIDQIGTVERIQTTEAGREITVRSTYDDLAEGESVAVNGACLTVRERGRGTFSVAAAQPTIERTTIGGWTAGLSVNLERSLRADSRLGGHIVQGHVDGVAQVLDARTSADAWLIDVRVPADVAALLVPLGSVALDGVSLTVNALPAPDVLQVSVVDYTRRHTTLGGVRAGARMNVEADMLARYVRGLTLQPPSS